MKILNLNLWNYNNFESRKPKIIEFIKKHDPDIIAFQEVMDDIRFNKKKNNQAKQLNRALNYPYYEFYQIVDKLKERPEKYKNYCMEGIAILSKYPILKVEKKRLKKQKGDRYTRGNLYVRIKAEKIVDIVVVHFSNNDLFSLLHLLETLRWIKSKKITPIIMGDFNIRHPDWLHNLTEDDYLSSIKYKKYMSYLPADYTLDYILIPKKFKFKSFDCLGKNLSDHKALIANIKKNQKPF